MTDSSEPIHPPAVSIWETIESTISVFFAFVVGFVLAVVGIWLLTYGRAEPDFHWTFTAWALLMAAEGSFLLWLKWSLEGPQSRPFIPEFALQQFRWPPVLRPLVSAWWVAHLLAALGALWLVERGVSAVMTQSNMGIVQIVTLALASWVLVHCSLMYMLLAVTALHRERAVVYLVWRFRLVVDLVLTIGLLTASRQLH